MSMEELEALLEERGLVEALQALFDGSGVNFTHDHWEEPPGTPYGVFLTPGDSPFSADNEPWCVAHQVRAELYTKGKNPAAEANVEAAMLQAGIFFEKSEDYISDIRLYRVMYEFEL